MKLKVKSLKLKATKSLRSRRLRQSHAKQGFTLIELIMVIVIIGILSAVAIPMYVDLQNDARRGAEEGIVGGVRGGISIWHASALINVASDDWPQALDAAGNELASSTNKLFASVLQIPVTKADSAVGWKKVSDTEYTGPTGQTYTYSTSNGTFKST